MSKLQFYVGQLYHISPVLIAKRAEHNLLTPDVIMCDNVDLDGDCWSKAEEVSFRGVLANKIPEGWCVATQEQLQSGEVTLVKE